MTLRSRCQTRLATCRIAVSVAYKEIAKAEKSAAKDKQPVPRHLMDKLVENVAQAKRECYSAEASLMAVNKYPPLGGK